MTDVNAIAASVESLKQHFEKHNYICSDQIATAAPSIADERLRVPYQHRRLVVQQKKTSRRDKDGWFLITVSPGGYGSQAPLAGASELSG